MHGDRGLTDTGGYRRTGGGRVPEDAQVPGDTGRLTDAQGPEGVGEPGDRRGHWGMHRDQRDAAGPGDAEGLREQWDWGPQ